MSKFYAVVTHVTEKRYDIDQTRDTPAKFSTIKSATITIKTNGEFPDDLSAWIGKSVLISQKEKRFARKSK